MAMISQGFEQYNASIDNIKGIFKRLEGLLDTKKYEEELKVISDEVDSLERSKESVLPQSMQLAYEHYSLNPYLKRIEKLTMKLEDEVFPFYEIHLWTNKINEDIKNINEENADSIINETKSLIKKINDLNTRDKEDLKAIINRAYQCVYNVILNEEMLDKSDVLQFVTTFGTDANKESLGTLIRQDIKSIPKSSIVNDELKNIKKEGLGYDFLNPDIIRELALIELSGKSENFKRRKKVAVDTLTDEIDSIFRQKESLDNIYNENLDQIINLRINKAKANAKLLSFVLVPVLTFAIGNFSGKAISNNITEYKTTTRTINYETGNIVSGYEVVYDEKPNTYTATIKEMSPWKSNQFNKGYYRSVNTYEYIKNDDEEKIDVSQVTSLEKPKYKYTEYKDELSEYDEIQNITYYLTETFQDKNDTRKSTKYILPLSLVGVGIGIAGDVLLAALGIISISKLTDEKRDLAELLKREIREKKEIKEDYADFAKKVDEVNEEYKNVTKKYGSVDGIVLPQLTKKK